MDVVLLASLEARVYVVGPVFLGMIGSVSFAQATITSAFASLIESTMSSSFAKGAESGSVETSNNRRYGTPMLRLLSSFVYLRLTAAAAPNQMGRGWQ